MGWLSKLFGKKEEAEQTDTVPSQDAVAQQSAFEGLEGTRFGRYSDNNKSQSKTKSWYRAEELYKEKKYPEAFAALFDYLTDEDEQNVVFEQEGNGFSFTIIQGSKRIHGTCDGNYLVARVPMAVMETPSTSVMRRMLEMNYALYYCRSAMDEQNLLYLILDAKVENATPSKLYYGLRELATKADRQDDLLIADFKSLKPADTEHIIRLRPEELDIKFRYFRKWIEETLKCADELNQDSFSGAIAYLLLDLLYRIDFLIQPESKLLSDLERINGFYWYKKEDIPLIERNKMMKDAIRKLLDYTKEDFEANVFHIRATFATAQPATAEKVREHIVNANKDTHWYIDNKYPVLAQIINEYGVLHSQFVYSMPRVQTDLITIYLAVLHADFFADMGLKQPFYNNETKEFDKDKIALAVDNAINRFKDKFIHMRWDHSKTDYSNLYDFSISFSEQIANLNFETKR